MTDHQLDSVEKAVKEALAHFLGDRKFLVPRKVCDYAGGEIWIEAVEGQPDQVQPVLRLKEPLKFIKLDYIVGPKKDSP
jgi:hypothetical protein